LDALFEILGRNGWSQVRHAAGFVGWVQDASQYVTRLLIVSQDCGGTEIDGQVDINDTDAILSLDWWWSDSRKGDAEKNNEEEQNGRKDGYENGAPRSSLKGRQTTKLLQHEEWNHGKGESPSFRQARREASEDNWDEKSDRIGCLVLLRGDAKAEQKYRDGVKHHSRPNGLKASEEKCHDGRASVEGSTKRSIIRRCGASVDNPRSPEEEQQ
jgi:hypothetical protein